MATPHAQMERVASATSGYESPDEDNQPPFFTANETSEVAEKHRPSLSPSHEQYDGWEQDRSRRLSQVREDSHGTSVGDPRRNSDSPERTLSCPKVSLKDRIACYQWTWFAMTMATGGIANVLNTLSYRPDWVVRLGLAFFLFNICLFLMNCTFISIRFYLRPEAFMSAFTDQTESLFIPSFFVSLTMIFINTCQYGVPHVGPWLLKGMEGLYWVSVIYSVLASAGIYLVLWSTMIFPIHMMTPVWVFPAYPLLVTGPFAGNFISAAVDAAHDVDIHTTAVALSAIATQGAGCLIALMISAAFIYRLMTQKLPRDMQRPGVFISIGPYAFTVAGLVQIGNHADVILPPNFMGTDQAVPIVRILSIMVGLWLWGLSMWFFLVSVGSFWKYFKPHRTMRFQMTWWSFVFPNSALITATEAIAKAFDNAGLKVFACVMTVCLIIVWLCVFYAMLRSLRNKTLLWPEDSKID